jgi:SAM-dependent methyltransferase
VKAPDAVPETRKTAAPRRREGHHIRMRLNKACELEDFCDEEFLAAADRVFGPAEKRGNLWPRGYEDRKVWEITMVVLSMERHLDASRRRSALGIGAGTEASSFILTNYFDWVFATDLYKGSGSWKREAPSTMLEDPARHAGSIPFRPGRLVVQHMDAVKLRFEDNAFDFIYSCSSIEHFGNEDGVAAAAREMGRVIKPGGVIALSTELCIGGRPQLLKPATWLFSPEQIQRLIIDPSGCLPVDPPDYRVSAATRATPTDFRKAVREVRRMRSRLQDRWSTYPHVILELPDVAWTSIHLVLRKP